MSARHDSEPIPLLDADARDFLLDLARRSIAHGLAHGAALGVTLADLPAALAAPGAAFVTLHRHGRLRGCIGHLEPVAPLAEDVARNAWAAAFQDPRFPPLADHELAALQIEVSVLGPAEPIACTDEADLITQLRPGLDGLILADGGRRSTFLPSVWEQLPNPLDFVHQLQAKAGLPAGHWSPRTRAWRYHTESFGEDPAG